MPEQFRQMKMALFTEAHAGFNYPQSKHLPFSSSYSFIAEKIDSAF